MTSCSVPGERKKKLHNRREACGTNRYRYLSLDKLCARVDIDNGVIYKVGKYPFSYQKYLQLGISGLWCCFLLCILFQRLKYKQQYLLSSYRKTNNLKADVTRRCTSHPRSQVVLAMELQAPV